MVTYNKRGKKDTALLGHVICHVFLIKSTTLYILFAYILLFIGILKMKDKTLNFTLRIMLHIHFSAQAQGAAELEAL